MVAEGTIREIIGSIDEKSWTVDEDVIAPFLSEWRGRWHGNTPLLLLPKNTEEVAKIVRICAQNKTPLCVQGGNTGLVGGQIPMGEILLSTRRLNKIEKIDKHGMSLLVGAGAILADVQEAALKHGLKFPLSIASQGSCTIGGNIATNAGGVHVIKYGTMRNLVFGLEAVMADGSIFNGLSALYKNNTGYDLSGLLAGSEGTFGIITKACLKLVPNPYKTVRIMAAVKSPDNALELLVKMRMSALCMFELMPHLALEFVQSYNAKLKSPFAKKHNWYVLMDFELERDKDQDLILQKLSDANIDDAVIANNNAQSEHLMSLRENISAAQKQFGAGIKHDISVPVANVPKFIKQADIAVREIVKNAHILAFGHLGDGNIHYNIIKPDNILGEKFLQFESIINKQIYDIVCRLGGAISAEHGIGVLKKQELARRAEPAKIAFMRSLKKTVDKSNILNPRVLI